MWVSPIRSGLRSLKETVEVPRPPDLVVTMISPLSSLAGPTRQTILLADIHSAVSRQLWPQIERPEEEEKRKVTGVRDIDTGRQQKQIERSDETQTQTNLTLSFLTGANQLVKSNCQQRVRVQVGVVTGVGGHDLPCFHTALKLMWVLSGPLLAQSTPRHSICHLPLKSIWKLFGK